MSAFIVAKAHIDALLRAGLTYGTRFGPLRWLWEAEQSSEEGEYEPGAMMGGPRALEVFERRRHELTEETASAVGQMLWAANYQSVNYRYAEANQAAEYGFDRGLLAYGKLYPPVAVLKALDCYEYQACESPDWPTSQANAFCDALRRRVITVLDGYDGAPWEIRADDHRNRSKNGGAM